MQHMLHRTHCHCTGSYRAISGCECPDWDILPESAIARVGVWMSGQKITPCPAQRRKFPDKIRHTPPQTPRSCPDAIQAYPPINGGPSPSEFWRSDGGRQEMSAPAGAEDGPGRTQPPCTLCGGPSGVLGSLAPVRCSHARARGARIYT